MKLQMTPSALVRALTDGKILYKEHSGGMREFLIFTRPYDMLECKGWGSALGQPKDRLEEVLCHPERWKIHHHTGGYPFPWSIGYKERRKVKTK